jgi:hexosaminidase
MSPSNYAYLDLMQGDIAIEPRNYSSVRLNKSYQFNPTEGIADSVLTRIKGGQANLWAEQIYNMRHAEYMLWPRGMAIAESVWSPLNKKDWNNFYSKVEVHFGRLDAAGVKYAPSMYDPIIQPSLANNVLTVQLSTEIPGLAIHYSFDNSFPDQYYPKYTFPLEVPKDAVYMKMITYRDGKAIGRMVTVPVADLKARVRKK